MLLFLTVFIVLNSITNKLSFLGNALHSPVKAGSGTSRGWGMDANVIAVADAWLLHL